VTPPDGNVILSLERVWRMLMQQIGGTNLQRARDANKQRQATTNLLRRL